MTDLGRVEELDKAEMDVLRTGKGASETLHSLVRKGYANFIPGTWLHPTAWFLNDRGQAARAALTTQESGK